MRLIGICEERGSGIDKVVFQTEVYQLPAPIFAVANSATRVTLFAHKDFKGMSRDDRVRACYLHACLRYVQNDAMTNASLRERFGIEEKNAAIASRIIRDTLSEGIVKPYDPDQGKGLLNISRSGLNLSRRLFDGHLIIDALESNPTHRRIGKRAYGRGKRGRPGVGFYLMAI